jgi:hypothetical protein
VSRIKCRSYDQTYAIAIENHKNAKKKKKTISCFTIPRSKNALDPEEYRNDFNPKTPT